MHDDDKPESTIATTAFEPSNAPLMLHSPPPKVRRVSFCNPTAQTISNTLPKQRAEDLYELNVRSQPNCDLFSFDSSLSSPLLGQYGRGGSANIVGPSSAKKLLVISAEQHRLHEQFYREVQRAVTTCPIESAANLSYIVSRYKLAAQELTLRQNAEFQAAIAADQINGGLGNIGATGKVQVSYQFESYFLQIENMCVL